MKQDKFILENSAQQYHTEIVKGWEKLYIKKRYFLYQAFKKYFQGKKVLELGCADGAMTQWLIHDFESVTVVDGSEVFIKEIREKINSPYVTFICSLFEEYSPTEKYDSILVSHILEHVDEPVLLLKRIKKWLASEGRCFISVPNADSLHRLIGVKMGMLTEKDSLNEQDLLLGHKRVYTPQLLKSHIASAGYHIIKYGGIMIKPVSNRQIEAEWSDELIDAFFKLGEDLPDLCSEIYAVISKE